jgi:hypothetical protein
MQHALRYIGGFERNHSKLTPASTTFEGSDGNAHEYPAWPHQVDGLRFGYMEKAGKKFCVVRVQDSHSDVVLENDLVLNAGEHYGFGTHLSGTPTIVSDDAIVLRLLEDIIKKNKDNSAELLNIRARFKASTAKKPPEKL